MLYSAWENTTHTVLEFARALDTGDEAEDHPVLVNFRKYSSQLFL
jgi:hypothetical protein